MYRHYEKKKEENLYSPESPEGIKQKRKKKDWRKICYIFFFLYLVYANTTASCLSKKIRISKEINQNKKQETTLPFLRFWNNQIENRINQLFSLIHYKYYHAININDQFLLWSCYNFRERIYLLCYKFVSFVEK